MAEMAQLKVLRNIGLTVKTRPFHSPLHQETLTVSRLRARIHLTLRMELQSMVHLMHQTEATPLLLGKKKHSKETLADPVFQKAISVVSELWKRQVERES